MNLFLFLSQLRFVNLDYIPGVLNLVRSSSVHEIVPGSCFPVDFLGGVEREGRHVARRSPNSRASAPERGADAFNLRAEEALRPQVQCFAPFSPRRARTSFRRYYRRYPTALSGAMPRSEVLPSVSRGSVGFAREGKQ